MRFAHMADVHLGSWRQPELQQLNLDSFKLALDICIQQKVEFVVIAGDLFDSAYPPIEILEEAFFQLKRLKDSGIQCFYIAGSHDYSASGKTFLSVLEKAGFCKNVYNPEIRNEQIILNPVLYKNVALYGYPGKKSGLEVEELRKIKLQESPGLFRIFALHTCILGAVGTLPIDSIKESELPEADYYALGHLHINYEKGRFVYAGPIFPDNFQELEELNCGSFYIIETNNSKIEKIELLIKKVEMLEIEINNALTATDKIILEIGKMNIEDKIFLLKIKGKLSQGKTADIDFQRIENFCREKKAFAVLKSTSKLEVEETEIKLEVENMDKIEEEIINKYTEKDTNKFNSIIFPLINSLSLEKQEDETTATFNSRLFSELSKSLNIEL